MSDSLSRLTVTHLQSLWPKGILGTPSLGSQRDAIMRAQAIGDLITGGSAFCLLIKIKGGLNLQYDSRMHGAKETGAQGCSNVTSDTGRLVLRRASGNTVIQIIPAIAQDVHAKGISAKQPFAFTVGGIDAFISTYWSPDTDTRGGLCICG